ncbi:MAG: isoprenyl transferase [Candidatus Omnitrophica bacterium]|nr:isoprenyl transferase [Candidatus Omnitrophota bacterium]
MTDSVSNADRSTKHEARSTNGLPTHIAIIMDGNGRWARRRGLPRVAGHRAGIQSVRAVVRKSREVGVRVLTLYAFSIENWRRPPAEVDQLMSFLIEFLHKELNEMNQNGIRLMAIGRIEGLPGRVQTALKETIEATQQNRDMILNLALNYGGRSEIVDAVRRIAADIRGDKVQPEEIDEDVFQKYLYTSGLPDPDLLIRTSGEQRLSNFLLWQVSYAELYVTDTLWPDFGAEGLVRAIESYQTRERRFGGVGTAGAC